jgi:hypothetical protein
MAFLERLYNEIITPWYKDIEIRNQGKISKTGEEALEIELTQFYTWAREKALPYDFQDPYPSRDKLDYRDTMLDQFETLFKIHIIDKAGSADVESAILFLKYQGVRLMYASIRIEHMHEILLYKNYVKKTLAIAESEQGIDESITDSLAFLRRVLYLSIHDTEFSVNGEFYRECASMIDSDFSLNREKPLEHLFALNNYIGITLDHLFASLTSSDRYIPSEDFNNHYKQFKQKLLTVIKEKLAKSSVLYNSFETVFRLEYYKIKLAVGQGKPLDNEGKKRVLILATNLIRLFFGRQATIISFFDKNHDTFTIPFADALKALSAEIKELLQEDKRNVLGLLYTIYEFMAEFPEYNKLAVSMYQRIIHLCKLFCGRRIYIMATMVYLRILNNPEIFKREIVKLKRDIEIKPINSLINLYNNSLSSFRGLPPNLLSFYMIHLDILDIQAKVHQANSIIFEKINEFKSVNDTSREFQTKLDYIINFQNEMRNVYGLVMDPYLVRDLGADVLLFR